MSITPKNLKQALEAGYVLKNIYNPQGPKCRVDLVERFHAADRAMHVSFWLTRRYLSHYFPHWLRRFNC